MLQPSNGLNNIEMKYESWRILNIADAMGKFRKAAKMTEIRPEVTF